MKDLLDHQMENILKSSRSMKFRASCAAGCFIKLVPFGRPLRDTARLVNAHDPERIQGIASMEHDATMLTYMKGYSSRIQTHSKFLH